MSADRSAATEVYDLAEVRSAAGGNGESETTVYIGGIGWDVVRALVAVVDAANDLTLVNLPRPTGNRTPEAFYPAMDKLLAALNRFENRGDDA